MKDKCSERCDWPNCTMDECVEMTNRQKTMCAYCGSEISQAIEHPFLSGLFNYEYCSEDCLNAHIDEK